MAFLVLDCQSPLIHSSYLLRVDIAEAEGCKNPMNDSKFLSYAYIFSINLVLSGLRLFLPALYRFYQCAYMICIFCSPFIPAPKINLFYDGRTRWNESSGGIGNKLNRLVLYNHEHLDSVFLLDVVVRYGSYASFVSMVQWL